MEVDFLACQEREELTDLEVVCRDGRVAAHRLVIASFSPFLRGLLEAGGEEEWGELTSLLLPGVAVGEVRGWVRCVYSNTAPESEGVREVCRLLTAPHPGYRERGEVGREVQGTTEGEQNEVNEVVEENRGESTKCQVKSNLPSEVDADKEESETEDEDEASDEMEEDLLKELGGIEAKEAEVVSKEKEVEGTKENNPVGEAESSCLTRAVAGVEPSCRFCRSPAGHRVGLLVRRAKAATKGLRSRYVCCSCGSVLGSPAALLAHQAAEVARGEGGEPWAFPCSSCKLGMREHGLLCCHCGEKFASPSVLTVHLRTVQGPHLAQCPLCPLAVSAPHLPAHLRARHPHALSDAHGRAPLEQREELAAVAVERLLEPCSECPRFLGGGRKERMAHYRREHSGYHTALLRHRREVWRAAPSSQYVPCDLCDKAIRKCNMKDHKLHTHKVDLENKEMEVKVKPDGVCDICGHVAKYARDLKKHKKSVHEKVFDHECTFCGKKFSNKGNLNQHESVHTGIKKFQCHLCGKKCLRKGELEKHLASQCRCGEGGGGRESRGARLLAKLEPVQEMETGTEVLVTGEGGRITTITQVCLTS